MPRKARLDMCGAASAKTYVPGTRHHIIVCEIKRQRIFSDDRDRDNFVKRLGAIVTQTQTFCLAWALMPNIMRSSSLYG
jgi:putative transposase